MNPKKERKAHPFRFFAATCFRHGLRYFLMQEAGFGRQSTHERSRVHGRVSVRSLRSSSGASILTIAVTALFMNSRQSFYALTFLSDFKHMGKRRPYMIHSLTDETYAVNCTLESLPPAERRETMFYLAVLSHFYWTAASVLGGMLGQIIPFDMTGIDFCMTALFVTIFVDQWEKSRKHMPALAGLSVAIVALAVFGANGFMLPALLITSAILVFAGQKEGSQ